LVQKLNFLNKKKDWLQTNSFKPSQNKDVDNNYIKSYQTYHKDKKETLNYKIGCHALLLLDTFLHNYTLLDIGCGTAGYYHIFKNAKQITGIDYSKKMIEAIKQNPPFQTKTKFIHSSIDDYIQKNNQLYDAIHCGIIGRYVEFEYKHFEFAYEHLNPNGILLARIQLPTSPKFYIKKALKLNKFILTEKEFYKRMKGFQNKFKVLLKTQKEVQFNTCTNKILYLFLQKI